MTDPIQIQLVPNTAKHTTQAVPELESGTYYIHNNGGRPYKVIVTEQLVLVHRQDTTIDSVEPIYEEEAYFIFSPPRVFIGISPFNSTTEFSGGYGPRFDGNTILLARERDCQYVFIGSHGIYSFQALAPIVEFWSPVGNSDVPYPWAKDSAGNYYLLIEKVMFRNLPAHYVHEPYRWYYNNRPLVCRVWMHHTLTIEDDEEATRSKTTRTKASTKSKTTKATTEKDEEIDLDWVPDPERSYQSVTCEYDMCGRPIEGSKGSVELSIIDEQGNRRPLEKQEYINLVHEIGKEYGLQTIELTLL